MHDKKEDVRILNGKLVKDIFNFVWAFKKGEHRETAADNVADRKTAPTGEAEFLLTFKP